MQANELRGKKELMQMEIDARAEQDKQKAADAVDRLTVVSGLGEEAALQEFQREKEMLRERAKQEAGLVNFRFTKEQKLEKARIENGRGAVDQAVASGQFTQEQGEAAHRRLTQLEAGLITPSASFEEPQPPLESLITTDPATGARVAPARSMQVITPYEKTSEGIEQKARIDMEAKVASAEEAFIAGLQNETDQDGESLSLPEKQRRLREYRQMMSGEEPPTFGEQIAEGGKAVLDYISRNRPERQQQPQPQPQPPAAPQPEAPEVPGWIQQIEGQGLKLPGGDKIQVKVRPEFAQLPPEEGAALSVFEAMYKRWPTRDKVPPELRSLYDEVSQFANSYWGR
jgi:hypothetical protein